MKLKGLIVAMCVMLLCGCQSSGSKGGLDMYKGKNGQETYETAVNYFNKTVKYCRSEIRESGIDAISEFYVSSNESIVLSYTYVSGSSLSTFIALAAKNDQRISIRNKGNYDRLEVSTGEYKKWEAAYTDVTKKTGVTLKSIQREDKDNQIILNIKMEEKSEDTNEMAYIIVKVIVNSEGLIESQQSIYYTDNTFKKMDRESSVQYYKNINKISKNDFIKKYDTFVEAIQGSEGLATEEGYNKIKDLL